MEAVLSAAIWPRPYQRGQREIEAMSRQALHMEGSLQGKYAIFSLFFCSEAVHGHYRI
jgi:hypothetical protein